MPNNIRIFEQGTNVTLIHRVYKWCVEISTQQLLWGCTDDTATVMAQHQNSVMAQHQNFGGRQEKIGGAKRWKSAQKFIFCHFYAEIVQIWSNFITFVIILGANWVARKYLEGGKCPPWNRHYTANLKSYRDFANMPCNTIFAFLFVKLLNLRVIGWCPLISRGILASLDRLST